jgi:hypothetical protein
MQLGFAFSLDHPDTSASFLFDNSFSKGSVSAQTQPTAANSTQSMSELIKELRNDIQQVKIDLKQVFEGFNGVINRWGEQINNFQTSLGTLTTISQNVTDFRESLGGFKEFKNIFYIFLAAVLASFGSLFAYNLNRLNKASKCFETATRDFPRLYQGIDKVNANLESIIYKNIIIRSPNPTSKKEKRKGKRFDGFPTDREVVKRAREILNPSN